MKGKVLLVGAGPGDPGLITLRGLECIRQAQVLVYDYLASPRLVEQAPAEAEKIYVGKKASQHTLSQEGINQLIIDKAKEGKLVVRLKGGDPFMFGRGGEEAQELLQAGIPFEIVPGVTSAISVPAYAGIPLTHRDFTPGVAFFTGHEGVDKQGPGIAWDKIATGVGTLVFFMGVGNLPHITQQLIQHGRSPQTPVALIRWGTTPRQKTVVGTLADIVEKADQQGIKPPAITVVGEVVTLREQLNWFEQRPLFGKGILVTRSRTQASQLTEKLAELGAEVFECPTIQIEPMDDYQVLDEAIRQLGSYKWLIFTSVNGVEYFFDRLWKLGMDVRALYGLKLCAIGPATAKALTDRYLRVDIVPSEYRAEAIIEALAGQEINGQRVLIARALEAREILPQELEKLGARVEVVPVYKAVPPQAGDRLQADAERIRQLLADKQINVVTFASSSTVDNFVELIGRDNLKPLMDGVAIASIGPITAKTVEKYGLTSRIMPKEYTIPALVKTIGEYFSS